MDAAYLMVAWTTRSVMEMLISATALSKVMSDGGKAIAVAAKAEAAAEDKLAGMVFETFGIDETLLKISNIFPSFGFLNRTGIAEKSRRDCAKA